MKAAITTAIICSSLFASAQNVGIGSPNPAEKLEVDGNIKMTNAIKGILLNSLDAPLITRSWDPFTSGALTGVGRWGLFMQPSRISLGIPNIAGKGVQFLTYDADGTPRPPILTAMQNGRVSIGSDNPDGRLQIQNDSSLFMVRDNGNIGINVYSPNSKLEIKGSGGSPFLIKNFAEQPIMSVSSEFFYNTVNFGGASLGPTGTVNISNSFLSAFANPQLKLVAVNDYPGGGSESIMDFINNNNVDTSYRFRAQTGTNGAANFFALERRTIGPTETLLRFNSTNQMRVGSLAGTGTRNLTVLADGTIATAGVTGFVSIPVYAFVKSVPSSSDVLSYFPTVGIPAASLQAGSTGVISAPVTIPHGATLVSITYWFNDNSASDLAITLYSAGPDFTGRLSVASYTTSGAVAGARTATSTTAAGYVFSNEVRNYWIDVVPAASAAWSASLAIRGVSIEYTL